MSVEEIRERWPKLFPERRIAGELEDFVREANKDIQTLLAELEKVRELKAEILTVLDRYHDQLSYCAEKELREILKEG